MRNRELDRGGWFDRGRCGVQSLDFFELRARCHRLRCGGGDLGLRTVRGIGVTVVSHIEVRPLLFCSTLSGSQQFVHGGQSSIRTVVQTHTSTTTTTLFVGRHSRCVFQTVGARVPNIVSTRDLQPSFFGENRVAEFHGFDVTHEIGAKQDHQVRREERARVHRGDVTVNIIRIIFEDGCHSSLDCWRLAHTRDRGRELTRWWRCGSYETDGTET